MGRKRMIENILGNSGRLLHRSKGEYSFNHPDHFIIYNANIFSSEGTKLWYGDLDFTVDTTKLKHIALESNRDLYVFYESDGRFDKEFNPDFEQAVFKFDVHGGITLRQDMIDFLRVKQDDDGYTRIRLITPRQTDDTPDFVSIPIDINAGHWKNLSKTSIQVPITILNKNEEPYLTFYKAVANELDIHMTKLDVSNVIVNEDDATVLNEAFYKYLKDKENLSGYQLKKNYSWGMFMYSPVAGKREQLDPGTVLVVEPRNE